MKYVSRRLVEKETYFKYGDYFPIAKEGLYTLLELIEKNERRILLLGDAGFGKSTELEHIMSRFIDDRDVNHLPIPVKFDTYVDEEIETYIRSRIDKESKGILELPHTRLVFLFDEFDQALNKTVAVRKVLSFIETYKDSTFIIAARTNFYSGQFDRFLKTFYLPPYNWTNVEEYVKNSLSDYRDFLRGIESISHNLVRNPFFLHKIVDIYKERKSIPGSINDIFSNIVEIALSHELERLKNKYDYAEEYNSKQINEDLLKLSLIMEMIQKNYLPIGDLGRIIADEKKKSIVNDLSLVKRTPSAEGYIFQFQHNNFQEYFAAKKLLKQNRVTVLNLISFRTTRIPKIVDSVLAKDYIDINIPFVTPKIRNILLDAVNCFRYRRINRINPSWLNTVSFLCQLETSDYLLKYFENVEPELTLKFEKNRLDNSKQERLFKTIFQKYADRKIFLDRKKIDYQVLADFSDSNDSDTVEYLMRYAKSQQHFTHRDNAIEILSRKRHIEERQKKELKELLIKYIKDENENDNVRHTCFYALHRLGYDDTETIDQLIYLGESNNDWVLAGLYYLIKESKYTERYTDTIISGIKNTRRELMDVSINVNDALEKIQSPEGLKKVIYYLEEKPLEYEHYHIDRSIKAIIENSIKFYNKDNSLYDAVSQLAVRANRHHQNDLINTLRTFFIETKTSFKLFQDLLNNSTERNHELLAVIADLQCIELMLSEYEKGKIDDLMMSRFVSHLSFRDKVDSRDLINLINKRTNKFYLEPPKDYEKEKKEEFDRKVDIVFDKKEFIKEVRKIFEGERKKILGYKNIDNIMMRLREADYNRFVLITLHGVFKKDPEKKWKLDELLDEIDNEWDYDWFTVYAAFDLYHEGNKFELSEERKEFIRKYCMQRCRAVNFREALTPSGNYHQAGHLAVVLWFFLQEYCLDYPEEVLLDMLSFHWSEHEEFGWISFLDARLPKNRLINRVLENIRPAIIFKTVKRNHIFLCRKYSILESKDFLCNTIRDTSQDIETRSLAVEAIGTLPGTVDFLEGLLNSDEIEIFKKASNMLVKQNREKAEKNLLIKLSSENEQKRLEAAELLMTLQNPKGIMLYCEHLKRTKEYDRIYVRDGSPLRQIETEEAIPILIDLLGFCYSHINEFKEEDLDTLERDIKETLKNIAIKGRNTLDSVTDGLRKLIRNLEKESERVSFLNMTIDNIQNTFFTNSITVMTLDDAIEIANRLQ